MTRTPDRTPATLIRAAVVGFWPGLTAIAVYVLMLAGMISPGLALGASGLLVGISVTRVWYRHKRTERR